MNSRQALARGVAALRRQRGWTQAHLAEASDLSIQFLAAIEQGTKSPSFDTLDALCSALRVRVSELFAAGEEPGKARAPRRELASVVDAMPIEREAEVIELLHAVSRIIAPKARSKSTKVGTTPKPARAPRKGRTAS